MGSYREIDNFTRHNSHNVYLPQGDVLPLVYDSPHSGLSYPADFLYRTELGQTLLRSPEDAHIEELYDMAVKSGATLIDANFPRAYIDVNRRVGDIDPTMIKGEWPFPLDQTNNSKTGAGLFWKVVQKVHQIYPSEMDVNNLVARVENCYQPYHQSLKQYLDKYHQAFGGVWHMDCHSCQSFSLDSEGEPTKMRPEIILGNRFGQTSSDEFLQVVKSAFESQGYEVIANTMFPGAELVTRYGKPEENRHSLQIEIRRDLYMDDKTHVKNERFETMKKDCSLVVASVAEYVRSQIK